MAFSIATKSTLLAELGLMLLAINGFNLLPMVPLDGGRPFQLLLFSRHRYLELAFTPGRGAPTRERSVDESKLLIRASSSGWDNTGLLL
jgi:membrane-associated protease RseP (regulator of RpoE activity)